MRILAVIRAMVISMVIAILAAAAYELATRHPYVVDISSAGRNTLARQTVTLLKQLPGPLVITAVLPRGHAASTGIEEFFKPYQRAASDLHVEFFDPAYDPERARQQELRLGEIVISAAGRREHVTTLSEREIVNALARLSRAGDRYITFLNGNGERQINRQANHDISLFADYMRQRGLRLRELALGEIASIPTNTAVLVIASPATAYSAGDLQAIIDYLEGGGNLLWLSDPDRPAAMRALEKALGVAQLAGTVIDPVGLTKFRNPAYAVARWQDQHAVLEGFTQTVVFPFAAAIAPLHSDAWQSTALARSSDNAWTETGELSGNVGFDADDEVQASHYLALALTRTTASHSEQRVIVVGDGDFISNAFVENLGNRELGGRMIEWLARDDNLIDLPDQIIADGTLTLAMWQRLIIFMVFGIGLPLSLLANGMLYWWRRRHA